MLARFIGYVFGGCVVLFALALTFGPPTLFEDLKETPVEKAKDVPAAEESAAPGEEPPQEEGAGIGLLGLFSCLVGSVFLGLWALNWHRTRLSKTWPTVQGAILASSIVHTRYRIVDVLLEGSSKAAPVVTYAYRAADGQQYEGEGIADKHWGSRAAQKWVQSHPVGTPIPVSYDPTAPELSTLPEDSSGFGGPAGVFKFAGPFMIAIGVWMIIEA